MESLLSLCKIFREWATNRNRLGKRSWPQSQEKAHPESTCDKLSGQLVEKWFKNSENMGLLSHRLRTDKQNDLLVCHFKNFDNCISIQPNDTKKCTHFPKVMWRFLRWRLSFDLINASRLGPAHFFKVLFLEWRIIGLLITICQKNDETSCYILVSYWHKTDCLRFSKKKLLETPVEIL